MANPRYVRALVDRALVHRFRKEYDVAIKGYTAAQKLEPKNAAHFRGRAETHHARGDRKAALADYVVAIRLDPRNATLDNARGEACHSHQEGNLAAAQANYKMAIRLDPKLARAYSNLGHVRFHVALLNQEANEPLRADADFRRALENFDEALELDPNDVQSYVYRGRTRLFSRDYRGGAADFPQALRITPKDVRLHFQRGFCLFGLDAHEAAARDFKSVPVTAEEYPQAQLLLGECHLALKKYDDAIAAIRVATETNPGDGYSVIRLACAFLLRSKTRPRTKDGEAARTKDVDEAFKHLRQARKGGARKESFDKEPDLKSIREDPRYAELFKDAK